MIITVYIYIYTVHRTDVNYLIIIQYLTIFSYHEKFKYRKEKKNVKKGLIDKWGSFPF